MHCGIKRLSGRCLRPSRALAPPLGSFSCESGRCEISSRAGSDWTCDVLKQRH
ncbi:hypothetical protein BJX64DRAFT_253866 [Aspergillus heterothallicus]